MSAECFDEDCSHYGCKLKRKGIMLSSSVTATRTKTTHRSISVPPAINAEIVYDERPGGAKMPLMNPDGTVVRHKQYRDNQTSIEATRRRIRNDTTAQGS